MNSDAWFRIRRDYIDLISRWDGRALVMLALAGLWFVFS